MILTRQAALTAAQAEAVLLEVSYETGIDVDTLAALVLRSHAES